MGDSELVTRHRAFHITSPEATTLRKLRSWKRTCQVSVQLGNKHQEAGATGHRSMLNILCALSG